MTYGKLGQQREEEEEDRDDKEDKEDKEEKKSIVSSVCKSVFWFLCFQSRFERLEALAKRQKKSRLGEISLLLWEIFRLSGSGKKSL